MAADVSGYSVIQMSRRLGDRRNRLARQRRSGSDSRFIQKFTADSVRPLSVNSPMRVESSALH
jgi:hypothetical protein